MTNVKHTPEIAFSTLKQGATDWTDEHAVNVLDDKGRLVLKAQVSVYFDYEAAANNAAVVVKRYNTQREMIEVLQDILDNVLIDFPDDDARKVRIKELIKKATN